MKKRAGWGKDAFIGGPSGKGSEGAIEVEIRSEERERGSHRTRLLEEGVDERRDEAKAKLSEKKKKGKKEEHLSSPKRKRSVPRKKSKSEEERAR